MNVPLAPRLALAALCLFPGPGLPQEVEYRPPITLMIPGVHDAFSDADIFETPDRTPARILLRVANPLAADFARFILRLNGQAVTFAATLSETGSGKLIDLNLRLRDSVRLQNGPNAVELIVVDRRGRRHHRPFLVRTREASRNRYFAYETRDAAPDVEILSPLGPVVFLGAEPSLQVPFLARIRTRSAPLKSLSLGHLQQSLSGEQAVFEHTISVPRSASSLRLTVEDAAGSRTVVSVPVDLSRPPKPLPAQGNRFALIVEVSPHASGTLADLLVQRAAFPKQNILSLTGGQATTASIRAALETFLLKPQENDLVFVYFAGHAANSPLDPDDAFLATHDTQPNSWRATALAIEEFERAVRASLRARNAIFLFDVASPLPPGWASPRLTTVYSRLAGMFPSDPGKAVLVAAPPQEPAATSDPSAAFSAALLSGLQGAADFNADRSVSASELFDFLCHSLARSTSGRLRPFYYRDPPSTPLVPIL